MAYTLTPFDNITSDFILTAEVRNRLDMAFIDFSLLGDISLLDISESATGRGDELWNGCAFELFIKDENADSYREYNFSFSGQWNCYDFESYREGQALATIDEPDMMIRKGTQAFRMSVVLPWSEFTQKVGNITAVLKFKDGSYSYWATKHTEEKPDFHAPKAFDQSFESVVFSVPEETGKDRAEGIIKAINEHNNS